MAGVGFRIKELSGTLASLGRNCEKTAKLVRHLGDVRGRGVATKHAVQEVTGAIDAMQTETERTLFALKSVKLGKTLKELHALTAWVTHEANLVLRQASSEPHPGMTVKHEVWLVQGGQAFGKEAAELLRRIEETGSLKGAAAEIKMSLTKAWHMFRDIERGLGFTLLKRTVGGASRGGSQLTPAARNLLRRYEALSQDVEEALQEIYAKYFG
jgi:molybdate transport system regulatory protein